MTLEAGKEMDKRCVLNWLNEVYVTPSRAFNEYTEDELKMFAHDALVLLKEQEPKLVKVNGDYVLCPSCGNELFTYPQQKFCDECGQAVLWE